MKVEYENYIKESILDALRKIFKEELGYKENVVEVERFVAYMRGYIDKVGIIGEWREEAELLIDNYKLKHK